MRRNLAIAVMILLAAATAPAERIKDICDIKGVRSNPLWGYGVVVGLNGTGENSPASRQALTSILRREGITAAEHVTMPEFQGKSERREASP